MGIFDHADVDVDELKEPFHQLRDGDIIRIRDLVNGTHPSPNNDKITVFATLRIETFDERYGRVSVPHLLDITSKRLFWALKPCSAGQWYRVHKDGKGTAVQFSVDQAGLDDPEGPIPIRMPAKVETGPKRPYQTDAKANKLVRLSCDDCGAEVYGDDELAAHKKRVHKVKA